MKIKTLLADKQTTKVEGVLLDTPLHAVARILIDLRIGALVVRDSVGETRGIVSERDLLVAVADHHANPNDTPVSKIMTPDVITCKPDDEIGSILRLMNANSIRHIPIVEDEKLLDMVSIRELTRAYDLLQKEADTDPLTELSSRRPFLRRLETEFARAKRYKHPLAVAMIDFDHFKAVNDTYGHDAGDKVLRAVSAILITNFATLILSAAWDVRSLPLLFLKPMRKVRILPACGCCMPLNLRSFPWMANTSASRRASGWPT